MIQSLHVENFRCFKDLSVEDFGRFNIVVGNNAGGKTALLEAIYLPGGGPDYVFKYFTWRGLPFPQGQWTRSGFESLWRDLFYQFDFTETISIKAKGTPENNRELRLFFDDLDVNKSFPASPIPGLPPPPPFPSPASTITPVVFETTDGNGDIFTLRSTINAKGEYEPTGSVAPALISFIPSSFVSNATEAANMFSDLSKKNKSEQLQEKLRAVFPDISDISIEILSGGVTSLYCAMPGVKEKVPIGLVSTGVSRLVQILLNIAVAPNGAVVVDEIENGFYYKALPKVWEAIILFCEAYNVQLFASTHSGDCLKALEPFLRTKYSDFRLLRAEVTKGHAHTVRVFNGKDFDAALESGTEVR